MWNKLELLNKIVLVVCINKMVDCVDKIIYVMMFVFGSKISLLYWDFVVELEYYGFVKVFIY